MRWLFTEVLKATNTQTGPYKFHFCFSSSFSGPPNLSEPVISNFKQNKVLMKPAILNNISELFL